MRELKIFGKSYPIVKTDLLKSEGNYGSFDNEKIYLDNSLDGVEETATEIHEFFHAVAERTGLSLTSIHPDLWEIICENFSRALVENYKVEPL